MSAKGEDFHILAFRNKLMFKYLCRYVTPCPCQHVFGVNRYPKNLCIMFGLCKNQNAHCLYIVMYNVSHHFFIISVYKKYINRMVKRERIKQTRLENGVRASLPGEHFDDMDDGLYYGTVQLASLFIKQEGSCKVGH